MGCKVFTLPIPALARSKRKGELMQVSEQWPLEIEQWLAEGKRILIAPGWKNSPAGHWQSEWQAQFPAMQRVEQPDWDYPVAADWVRQLDQTVRASSAPALIVAHSLACPTLAHWAALHGRESPVKGVLLVAPADVMRPEAPEAFTGFAPLPIIPLPFFSWIIASTTDPHCSTDRASQLALNWRCKLSLIENAGHINIASGHGEWPEGLQLLAKLIQIVNGDQDE